MGLRSTPPRKAKTRFRLKSWGEWFAAVAKRGASSHDTPPLSAYRLDLALSDERRARWLESSRLARYVAESPKAHAEAAKSELDDALSDSSSHRAAEAASESGLVAALDFLQTLLVLPAFHEELREERLDAVAKLAKKQELAGNQASALAILQGLLVGVEAPLLAAASFPESKRAAKLAELASRNASRFIDEGLDGDGMIAGRLAEEYPLIAASLMRCAAVALALPGSHPARSWLDKDRRHQIEMLPWHLWRLVRADGTLALPQVYSRIAVGETIDFAAQLVRDGEESEALKRIANRLRKRKLEKRTGTLIVDPMCYSGWAEQAVLRTNEKLAAPRFVLNFSQKRYRAELLDRGEPILSGDIETTLTIDGQAAPQTGDWHEVCWHSDDEGDYLELEATFGESVRVQRQVYLDRQEQIFLLADALLLERPAEIVHEMRWSCAPKILVQTFDETTEVLLDGPSTATTVFPLASAEWREAPSACRLSVETVGAVEALQMVYRGKGEGAFVPWCFHFTGSRRGIPVTWRKLTIAEDRHPIPSDQAAGYRVQVGDDQWMVYRSLDGVFNRTLLGQNINSEFYLARFLEDGTVEKMLELQPDEEEGDGES